MIAFLVNQTAESAKKPPWMTIHSSHAPRIRLFRSLKQQANFLVSPKVLLSRRRSGELTIAKTAVRLALKQGKDDCQQKELAANEHRGYS